MVSLPGNITWYQFLVILPDNFLTVKIFFACCGASTTLLKHFRLRRATNTYRNIFRLRRWLRTTTTVNCSQKIFACGAATVTVTTILNSQIFFACGEQKKKKQLPKYFSPAALHFFSNIFRLRRYNNSQIFLACGAQQTLTEIFFACGASLLLKYFSSAALQHFSNIFRLRRITTYQSNIFVCDTQQSTLT